jgi:outer membrane protein OmpA-like peptidoglycan-associated protein
MLLAAAFFVARPAQAQLDQTMYNMPNVPQSIYMNPALIPTYKINIGLPVISSLYYNGVHTGFYAKTLVQNQNDSVVFDIDGTLDRLAKLNTFSQNFQTDLLHVGFRTGDAYVHMNIGTNVDARFNYPRDLFELAWKGNGPFVGRTADLSGFGPNVSMYHEIGFGYARPLNEKLTIGAKARFLMGVTNLYTKRSDLTLATDDVNFGLTAAGSMDLNMSGIMPFPYNDTSAYDPNQYLGLLLGDYDSPIEKDPVGYFLGGFNNPGFGIDLGASYDINDKFNVSASVVDLGLIRWKRGVANLRMEETSFTFTGLDIASWPTDSLGGNFADSLAEDLLDSLEGSFRLDTTAEAYTTPLTPRFTVAGNFNVTEKMNASLVFTGEIYRGNFRPAVTLGYNAQLGRLLSAHVNWSYMNRSPLNIGTGLALNLGPIQLYAAADNMVSFLGNRYIVPIGGDSTGAGAFNAPIIKTSKTRHVHAGMNITIGREKRDRDGDGIFDKEDNCPDDPGLPEFQGCPDVDGDKIPDHQDACPEIPGVAEFTGCPDTDGDHLTDTLDGCPTEPGPLDLNGCPDRDNDKIIDKEDKCPDQFGPKETQGCPDKDRDGVLDSDDLCPEKPGPADHKGCPDSDGDTVYDNEDRCVDEFGPVDNMGCPYGDLDKDGVLDREDKCPDTPGPVENKGCPWGDLDLDGVTDNVDDCPNQPGPASNKGCPEELTKAFELAEKTKFKPGSAIIEESSKPALDTVVARMAQYPDVRIKLVGHTDSDGSETANLTLSKNRTMAIFTYLTTKGVDAKRLETDWKGETMPIDTNATPAGKANNRRVEITVIKE